MNWADLSKTLLIAATVFPLLLSWLGLLSRTETLMIITVSFTASTAYAFLQGEPEAVALFAALAVTTLLMLRRHRANARKNTESAATKPQSRG